jgi:Tfp pilus assembly protein FimT
MKPGHTLLEVIAVCAIAGILAALAAPRVHATLDSMAVESAARDVVHALALGRLTALSNGSADVRFDSTAVTVHAGNRVVYTRDLAQQHGVSMHANTAIVRYAATGLATGVGNGSVFLSRGASADTVVISRLGRVRR